MANKLYPPIIENALPAFYGNTITISYTLNRGVGYDQIIGFSLVLKSTVTNEIIRQRKTYQKSNDIVTFGLNATEKEHKLLAGGFYKIQLAFLSGNGSDETVGYYSTVGIAKYLGEKPPILTIENRLNDGGCFVGVYDPQIDITEKMYSYQFSLYDSNGMLIETSGEILHNSASDVELKQSDSWAPVYGLDNGSTYRVVFSVTTMNNLKLSKTIMVAANKDEQGYVPSNLQLIINYSKENGYMNLLIKSTLPNDLRNLVYGKFQIFKTCSKDKFQSKQRIAYFTLQNQDLFEKQFKDFTVESGYEYRYVLQQVNDYGIYSEEIYSNTEKVFYEHMFLFDGVRQLKIKFNPKISSFKNIVFETKTDTIGSKYPFILRNPTVKYKEFNLSGLISYHMDEENFFLTDYEIWDGLQENEIQDDLAKTHNLTDDSISAEKRFKNYVLDWLNNGEIKMLKTATEGIFLVRLMNVSLSPNDTVGRMLHTFTATAYEVQDVTSDLFSQVISIDRAKRYIGYKTIPLYDFPKKTIIEKGNDNKWAIVYNNNAYEIINNTALEYVTGARFEDIKPGTRFNIILERNSDVINFNLEIGATGTHRIDTSLGYHIRSIKLEAPTWSVGDYTSDVINNRGQVTYEYERQAAHNNFNDITKINAETVVGRMWNPTWYIANVEEPLVTMDNKFLYSYQVIDDSIEGYIQVGYFEKYAGVDTTEEYIEINEYDNTIDYYYYDGHDYKQNNSIKDSNSFNEQLKKYSKLYYKDEKQKYSLVQIDNNRKFNFLIYNTDYITKTTETNELEYYLHQDSSYENTGVYIRKIHSYYYKDGEIEYKEINKYDNNITEYFYYDGSQYIKNDNIKDKDSFNEQLKKYSKLYYKKDKYKKINKSINSKNDFEEQRQKYSILYYDENQIFPSEKYGCEYQAGQHIYDYEESKKLIDSMTSEELKLNQAVTADRFKWSSQNFDFTNYKDRKILFPIYNNNIQGENPTHCLKTDGVFDKQDSFNTNDSSIAEYYKQVSFSADSVTHPAIMFIPRHDSQGSIISTLIQKNIKRNPFYIRLYEYDDNQNTLQTLTLTKKHKVEKMYSKQFFDGVKENVPINYAQNTIYKNFASNIYYNDTNVNGEYYIKEDIMNLYKIDFELIQVFYNEDLIKTKQNFEFTNAYVQYENNIDDGFYQNTEQVLSNFCQIDADGNVTTSPNDEERLYTTTQPGRKYENIDGLSEQQIVQEAIISKEKHYYNLLEFIQNEKFLSVLFNYNKDEKDNYLKYHFEFPDIYNGQMSQNNFLTLLKTFPGDLYYKQSIDEKYFYQSEGYVYSKLLVNQKLPDSIINNNSYINLNKVYVNAFVQSIKNYTQDITPKENEIVIVYATNTIYSKKENGDIDAGIAFFGESYPQRIDLSDRFSYSLEAKNYDQGLNNILGIYLGKNVRAFATYKRKMYNYRALVGDGVYKDLVFSEV